MLGLFVRSLYEPEKSDLLSQDVMSWLVMPAAGDASKTGSLSAVSAPSSCAVIVTAPVLELTEVTGALCRAVSALSREA